MNWGDVEELLKSPPNARSSVVALPATPVRSSGVSAFAVWLAVGLMLNTVLAIDLLTGFGLAGHAQTSVVNLLTFLVPLATLHLCFPANVRRRGRAPVLLGCAAMAYVCGRALYFAIMAKNPADHGGVVVLGPWGDIGTLAAFPLVMAALLWWPAAHNPPSQRFRNFLDLVVGAAGLWAFSWVFLVYPEIDRGLHPFWWEVSTVAHPTFTLLLVICLFQFFRRGSDPRFQGAARFFVPGLLLLIGSELATGTGLLHGFSGLNWAPRLAWPLAFTLFSLAALVYGDRQAEPTTTPPADQTADPYVEVALAMRPWYSLAPYTLVPAVAFLVLFSLARPGAKPYELGVVLGAVIMVGCLLLRQILAIKDNAMLLTRLQDAYHELTDKSNELKRTNGDLKDALGRLNSNNEELSRANAQLAQLVTIDGMTGLENHRAFQQHLRLEVDAAKRHRHPLSLIMADVDFFKRYNDEFGHPAGDEVLRQIAKAIMEEVGENAYPARYGGEEFSVVLPYLTASEALAVAERVGRAVATRVRVRRRITMSFGVATMEPHWTAETLVNEADRALYAAKAWGRNRAVLVTDLDRQRLSLDILDEGTAEFDPNEPMGLAAILSAGLRNHPQALGIEPDSQLAGGLLGTLELKDVETRDHSERVMWYAMRLAQSVIDSGILTMTQQELRALAYGALLHDIGKIGVPEHILKYPGTLDLEMRAVIREHPRLGAQIVQRFPTLDLALAVIRNHHERWDGRGYPSGLRGMDVPLVARIFAVVDALEAMTSKRPYSDPISIESVTERLMAGSGTNYDPAILRAYSLVPPEEWIKIRQRESTLAEQIGLATPVPI